MRISNTSVSRTLQVLNGAEYNVVPCKAVSVGSGAYPKAEPTAKLSRTSGVCVRIAVLYSAVPASVRTKVGFTTAMMLSFWSEVGYGLFDFLERNQVNNWADVFGYNRRADLLNS
jgi:hypothetical protein